MTRGTSMAGSTASACSVLHQDFLLCGTARQRREHRLRARRRRRNGAKTGANSHHLRHRGRRWYSTASGHGRVRPGTVCLNHPPMIDASRVGGPANGPAVAHSHILSEHAGGWFHTVNIRVRDVNVWNQIAAAKSLDKVRELQADPIIGVSGQRLISADTPTNIFFFIASWRPAQSSVVS